MTREKKVVLTKLELEVMRAVWEAQPLPITVREAAEKLNTGRARHLAYNTVHTMLTILKDKGVVRSRPGPGRAHQYLARLSQEEVTTFMIGDLVERLYDGQLQPFLVNLVEKETLSREELEAIRRVIDSRLEDREERP